MKQMMRLQKFLSECGVLSRRAAERAIEAGEVTVNGKTATIGQQIDAINDKVMYRGKGIKKSRDEKKTYVLLHKPKGFVTTLSDEKGRRCVAELVSDAGVRLYPVGRLDRESEGLLLMTNDGDLTNRLTHPRHQIPKIYQVRVSPRVTRPMLRALGEPMVIDDYQIQPVETVLLSQAEESSLLQMTLYEGRNRQIRKMCEQVGLTVLRLKRVAIGDITIEGVKKGSWRYLNYEEVKYLKGECEDAGN
jgi:23S rRNA pseudouridine2605 synthase